MVTRRKVLLAITIFSFSCFIFNCKGQQNTIVTAEVKEDQGTDSTVYRFPRPPSGEVYSFFRATDILTTSALKLFKISTLGVVTTTKPLIFTVGKSNKYDLTVLRRPQGATEGGIAQTLRVSVTDINNFPPTFGEALYYGRVRERAPSGTVVQGLEKCYAEDRDSSGVGDYKIVSGNERKYFSIQTDIIGSRKFLTLKTTNNPIIRDPNSPYITLTVQAQQSGTAKIRIEIEDANDHTPEFEEDSYSTKVVEDVAVQASVLRVTAKDKDVGTNGGIYYYLDPLNDFFTVDAITGVIKVVRPLDNGIDNTYTFTVYARDRGSPYKSSFTKVKITIKEDVVSYPLPDATNPGQNTHPFFPESTYVTSVREDFPPFGALLLIRAADNDPVGENKRLRYTLSGSGAQNFRINAQSGLVTLEKKVKFVSNGNNQYNLTVTATDGGGLTASSKLIIDIQDVDENRDSPNFSPQRKVVNVLEDLTEGKSVTTVEATDPDSGVDGKIMYSITQGSGMGIFQVDQTTGVVTTDAPLDREKRSYYDLVIKAEDKATFPKSSNLYLMIVVEDVDDNYPYFTQSMYIAKVPEKMPENTFVTVMRAADPDKNPSLSYAITSAQSAFKIESSTGVVRTARSLDLTRGDAEFELTVEATSSSSSSTKKSIGQLNVTVTSKADSPPVFKKKLYAVTVPENQGVVSNLLCIAAVDTHNAVVEYRIISGDTNLFTITKHSGSFSAKKLFDYEKGDRDRVIVEAVSASSRKAASTDVTITVSDEKDPPSFNKPSYTLSLKESTPPSTTISTGIRIIDQDTAINQFECSMEMITSLETIEYLSTIQDAGECKLVTKAGKQIDSSVIPQFKFDIRATDKNFRDMFATASVVVNVVDENNHNPEFSQTSYWVSVPSNTQPGTSILMLSTSDKDLGSFGGVTYSLGYANRFSIDDNSGEISSSSMLQRGTKYELEATAVDGGSRKAKVKVYVSVYDTTDTPVTFQQSSYSKSILESTTKNTMVVQVKATKSGSTSGISYELVGGFMEGSKKIFGIESSSGRVTLESNLDWERKSSYELVIRAKHTGGSVELASNVICTVTVEDVNDMSPQFVFDRAPKIFVVDNHSPADTVIATILAIDLDKDDTVTYLIAPASSSLPFKIDKTKGILMTKEKLTVTFSSSAASKAYSVGIEATDRSGKSATNTVVINVMNVNMPPKFPKKRYNSPLQENVRVGETVLSVKATYAVSNAFLKYSIRSGNRDNAFCIDHSGVITVARPLDREIIPAYMMSVGVALGNEQDFTTVYINLTDINDDSPQFDKVLYTFSVKEDAKAGSSVGKVHASDRDSGAFGRITYELLYGVDVKTKERFQVDATTGVIKTKAFTPNPNNLPPLDFEDVDQHVLFIKAEDNGGAKLSAITEVHINVEDVNDEDPKFSAASYKAKVSLDANVNDHVLQVTATDLDSGSNGQSTYSIVSGNEEGAFVIKRENGLISVGKSLSTVAADKFNLKVEAKDRGTPPRSSQVDVEINVFLPDGPPKFVVSPVYVSVREGIPANRRVAVAKAATAEALQYEIITGNTNEMFKINPSTGVIFTKRTLDYEENSKYKLDIVARDTRDRRANVIVVISVLDINDNPPLFPGEIHGQIDRKVAGPFSRGVIITRLAAIDKDVGDSITYKLSPASVLDNFEIDNLGQLIAKNNLANIPSPYRFMITASDSGRPQQVHSVNVRMVFVNYRPKQQPVRVLVAENIPVNSIITRVPKYFPSGTFSIIFPEKSNFSIDNAGYVRITSPLDFEKQAFHLITVREQQTAGKLTNDLDVEISVIDLNDNAPYFTMTSTLGRVNKNARAGANVFQLSARDLDSALNGLIGFQLLPGGTPFTVNPFTKKIEVGGNLKSIRLNPRLIPFDYGTPHLNGSSATIDVETSQTPPIFSKTSYKFSVFERAPIGKSIGKIDARSVSGARLKYFIEKGNTGDKFIVKDNGDMLVNSRLDFNNTASSFNLVVLAAEQIPNGLEAEIDVQIDVINANDFFPSFDKPVYQVTISESQELGSVIETVKVYDCDCSPWCQCKPGQIKFSLEPKGLFIIDEDTGQIIVAKTLDYESKKKHLLKVIAADQGIVVHKAVAFVVVNVSNANDNYPVFKKNDYEFRITEVAETKNPLAAVVAKDNDGDKITYSLVSGSSNFLVDGSSGVLELGSKIPLGSDKTEYTINIRAKDPRNEYSDVRVRMNLEHINTNRPRFTKCPTNIIEAKVQENLPKDQLIFKVVAVDDDKGRYGEIEFSVVPVGGENFFAINNRTGELFTTTSLDREKKNTYTVVIRAEDGGHSRSPEERLLTYCFLPVEIVDVNDNYPKFFTRTYLGSIQNNKPIGTPVLTVSATDADSGSNAVVIYSLKSYSDKFTIDSTTGQIRTSADLTGIESKEFLTVVASNKLAVQGSPSDDYHLETTVEIYISSKAPPVCQRKPFRARINEALATGTEVLRVVANAAGGRNVRYSPVKANADLDNKFSVSPSGIVTTGSQLDYEMLPENNKNFKLQVRAQEDGTNLYSTCEVVIELQDVNDDKPTFNLGSYDARVLENAPVGTMVMKVIAKDRDQGQSGAVSYDLDRTVADSVYFKIEPSTGIIRTNYSFDREKKDKYTITVIARDNGVPQLSEGVTVRVLIVDENDQPPKFNQTLYVGKVLEDAPLGTVVLQLNAVDRDIGDNAKLFFFISEGDSNGFFSVETVISAGKTYGVLVVAAKLDFETKNTYSIKVATTDGRTSDQTTVAIQVEDVNDEAPAFQKPMYERSIEEESPAGVTVIKLTATDVDSSSITYRLGSRAKDYFTIRTEYETSTKSYVGIITTGSKKLDREASPIRMFTVFAYDGALEGKTEVKINLTDINDRKPRFPSDQNYVGYVEENKPAGTSVMYVQAVDDDDPFTGGNAKIKYDLTNSAGSKFSIDSDTGLITTSIKFRPDTRTTSHVVTVQATDQGSKNQQKSTIDVTIYITDSNTKKPEFTQTIFRGTVPENAHPGYRVTAVSATDGDTGPNAELEFVVTNGNEPLAFYVDPFNGTVFVTGIVDYEVKKSYKLTVIVSDRGLPPLSGDKPAYLLITVTDTNDNAPVFAPDQYNKTVSESVNVGTVVVRVTATDKDSGTNAKFDFTITKGNKDDLFKVQPDPKNPNIGLVMTRLPLDRETIPIHHLEITATDTGGLKDTANIWLTLEDVNDNGPWFQPPFFVGRIKENTNAAQFVTLLSAYDPDSSTNGGPLTFSIVNGTLEENFRLVEPATYKNATSIVNSYGSFDREDKPTWKIGVAAVDSGKPKKNNFTYLYVDVMDDNDNEPFDGSMLIIVNAYKGEFIGGPIGKPYYKDADYDGDVNIYELRKQSPGSYFKVDPNSGNITADPKIPVGKYLLDVQVTESSIVNSPRKNAVNFPKTVTSSVRVIVRRIDPLAVKHSVALQFTDMRKVGFLVGDFYDSVVSVISNNLEVSNENVQVFSIQKAPDRLLSVNIQFAVKNGDSYMKPKDVIDKLANKKAEFERLGLNVGAVGIDKCAREKEHVGKCVNVVETSFAYHVASGDYGKVPAPDSVTTIVSMDVVLKDKYVSIITPQGNCSFSNPCLNGGTCHDSVPYGFMICECPREYRGPRCQQTTRTFYGDSYIWLPKLASYDIGEISFEFMTEKKDGLMLYQGPLEKGGNNGAKDFMAVLLRDGRVLVMVSLGSDPITINMTKGPRLDDKEWHTVQITRDLVDRKMVRVIIDRCERASIVEDNGRVFENRDACEVTERVLGRKTYLNGFGPLQIGGVSSDLSFLGIPTRGFKGCIRNIIDIYSMYDLRYPLKVLNAPEGCRSAKKCVDSCNGRGYCEPGLIKSVCVCDTGYMGSTCSDRSPTNFYLANSFSQFLLKTERAKRGALPPPESLTNEFYTNIVLKIKVDPNATDCVLFLSSNSLGTEFNRIDIKNHILRYIFRLGDRMKILSIPQLNITDGNYHLVVVKREGNYASMQVDYKGLVAGNTGGVHKLLNMGGGSFFSGGLPNITEVRVIEAIVQSGGNTILRTADGRVISSGIGSGRSGTSFGTGIASRLITIMSTGRLHMRDVIDSQAIFASGSGVRGVTIESLKEGKKISEVLNGRNHGDFGTAIGAQGVSIKNKYIGSGPYQGGVPIYDINGNELSTYGGGIKWAIPSGRTQTGASAGDSSGVIHVIGDFEGCTASNRFNGVDLEKDSSIDIRLQNVVFGCPCVTGFCLHGGTCVFADPPYCVCPTGWGGARCENLVTQPKSGRREESKWRLHAVVAAILVVLIPLMIIMMVILLKHRQAPPVVPVTIQDGHVHDNIRPYHDEGAGEEDNFGYDITQLMKYTYVEGRGGGGGYGAGGHGAGGHGAGGHGAGGHGAGGHGAGGHGAGGHGAGGYGAGGYGAGGYGEGGAGGGHAYGGGAGGGMGYGGGRGNGFGAGEEMITAAEDKPLLQGAFNGNGQQFGVTTITRKRVINPDSMDVGNFIEQRLSDANGDYHIAHDSLHMYKYEGDDSDVDDLSELGDSDNEDDQENEQNYHFLNEWGRKFDSLNRLYNLD